MGGGGKYGEVWCCQSNGNVSPVGRRGPKPEPRLGHDCAPLRQGGGASFPVEIFADEVALLTKMIVNLGVNRGEFLESFHPPKAVHHPLSSSERQVAVLGPVVLPSPDRRLEIRRA